MKKGGGSESTIIVGPSKSVLVFALHSLEYVLGLARFRVFVLKLYYYYIILYVNLMGDTTLLGIPLLLSAIQRTSLSRTVKCLFKVYKNQMQIGTVFSTFLDD